MVNTNRIAMINKMSKTKINTSFFALCTDAEIKEIYENWKKTGNIKKPVSWGK